MKISDIQRICNPNKDFGDETPHHHYQINNKKRAIDEYEKLEDVQTVDSAFPIQWADAVRKHFGVRNIGNWAWAYSEPGCGFSHGTPVPCCERSLAYFESMLGTNSDLIYKFIYEDDR